MDWKTFDFKKEKDVGLKELSKAKTMHSTKKRAIPLRTSDEIRTMCSARTTWSIAKSLSGCSRTKDDIRLTRNESVLKRRRLRKENIALRRKIRQMENLLEMEGG
ncbi:MAG: hypothetical protein KJ666_09965 [Bacteroidetes bacterium]|nr:hypothetical protein [Bacteroidota bacterium]